ncbi:phage tail protein I [Sphingomonas sp. QA11]|uniref:phage tail protein I n=1 Tax=Sphingomonas sp. QA11 TaxID=2950605 RepID=UPI00234BD4A0|nr:phage tail protein I [Sphingomonas sp. QA11]WCM29194.1 phage tail protein I [Sphingomonas sp. QA11]
MASNLLPPNATRLERALAGATARIDAIPIDVSSLWDPYRCPALLLPWLAWSFSTDRWNPDWSDDEKRAAVAGAIELQSHKGTRWSVEQVLASFDDLLELVEWFEASPRLDPHTFEVRLSLIDGNGLARGARVSADRARAIVAEVSKVKPVREHLVLVQQLALTGGVFPFMAAQTAGYRRLDLPAGDADPGMSWEDLIQDENGEPLTGADNGFIDGGPD